MRPTSKRGRATTRPALFQRDLRSTPQREARASSQHEVGTLSAARDLTAALDAVPQESLHTPALEQRGAYNLLSPIRSSQRIPRIRIPSVTPTVSQGTPIHPRSRSVPVRRPLSPEIVVHNIQGNDTEDRKDPLDFDAVKLAQKLVDWVLDPKQARHVKQRDREEIDFLQSMVKYEEHFNEEDKKKLRKRLRLFYLVSDLNWNDALNDPKEVNREDFGIEVSTRTASLCPWRRGRGRSGPSRGGVRGRGANTNYGRGGSSA